MDINKKGQKIENVPCLSNCFLHEIISRFFRESYSIYNFQRSYSKIFIVQKRGTYHFSPMKSFELPKCKYVQL